MRAIGDLPNADFQQLTHMAMKQQLVGCTLPDDAGNPVLVPTSFSRPEEWLQKRTAPSINLNAISAALDPTRFTTDTLQTYKDNTFLVVLEKGYPVPVNYIYEIRFIVGYGQHMMSLNEQIMRKFPPLGFGAYVSFPYGSASVMCPFTVIDGKDIFARYGETEDNREFEHVYRVKVESWLDVHETVELRTVADLDIIIEVIN